MKFSDEGELSSSGAYFKAVVQTMPINSYQDNLPNYKLNDNIDVNDPMSLAVKESLRENAIK